MRIEHHGRRVGIEHQVAGREQHEKRGYDVGVDHTRDADREDKGGRCDQHHIADDHRVDDADRLDQPPVGKLPDHDPEPVEGEKHREGHARDPERALVEARHGGQDQQHRRHDDRREQQEIARLRMPHQPRRAPREHARLRCIGGAFLQRLGQPREREEEECREHGKREKDATPARHRSHRRADERREDRPHREDRRRQREVARQVRAGMAVADDRA